MSAQLERRALDQAIDQAAKQASERSGMSERSARDAIEQAVSAMSAPPLTEDERRALDKASRALDFERDSIERGRRLRRSKNKKRRRR